MNLKLKLCVKFNIYKAKNAGIEKLAQQTRLLIYIVYYIL